MPEAVGLRSRIDDLIFTADVDAAKIALIEQDPLVVSVATNQKLRFVE